MESEKGGQCPYDGRFCQEGFCEGCEVYRQHESLTHESPTSISSFDEIVKQAQEKGLLGFRSIKFAGKASVVFAILSVLAETEPTETDLEWWLLRLWLVRN